VVESDLKNVGFVAARDAAIKYLQRGEKLFMPVNISQSNSEPFETQNSQPDSHSPRRDFIEKILIVVLFALLLFVLWQGAEVFLLIFAGFLVSVFLRSLSDFLSERAGLSENWSLTLVLLVIVALAALGAWLLWSGSMQNQFEELSDQLPAVYEQARERVAQYPLGQRIVEKIPPPSQIVLGRQSGNVFGRITGFFSTAFDVVVNVLIVLMTAIYFAYNPLLHREGIVKLVPRKREKRTREVLRVIGYTLRKFLLGISASMTINGVLTFLGLWFLDVPFAIPLGIIAGFLSFIPNIGPLIAGAPAVLIALAQSPAQALYVLILYLAVQNLDGFLLTPLIQQRAVSIPPVLIIAAQLLLAVIFGFLGLLLAVPIVAVVFVLVKMIYVEDILGRRVEVKGEKEAQEKLQPQTE